VTVAKATSGHVYQNKYLFFNQASAQLALTTLPNARARVHFADGSIKVLETFCGQKTWTKKWTKNGDKTCRQKTWTPKEVPRWNERGPPIQHVLLGMGRQNIYGMIRSSIVRGFSIGFHRD
jgi:hypothetical protein